MIKLKERALAIHVDNELMQSKDMDMYANGVQFSDAAHPPQVCRTRSRKVTEVSALQAHLQTQGAGSSGNMARKQVFIHTCIIHTYIIHTFGIHTCTHAHMQGPVRRPWV